MAVPNEKTLPMDQVTWWRNKLWESQSLKIEDNGGLSVNVQDPTTEPVDLFLHNFITNFTVASDTIVNTNTFDASPWHWIIAWNTLCFLEWANFSQFTVINVATDVITVDSPFDRVYTTVATYQHHTPNMAVDWSSTPQVFFTKPLPWQKWDITRILLVIEDNQAMDITKFWGIAKLVKWCVLRKKDWVFKNLFNWKSNGEWLQRAFDGRFDEKSWGWEFGFTWRASYGWQDKRGVVIRLDGDLNDEIQCIIQDDLLALTRMTIVVQGHVVGD